MAAPTPEMLAQALRALDPDCQPDELLDAIVTAEITRRTQARADDRAARRERRAAQGPQPTQGLFAALTSGRYQRTARPRANAEDRQWVPGALHHWRTVHGLSQAQAQARIGYSATSNTWRMWESGATVPPYSTLLRMLAATGLGFVRQVPAEALPTSGTSSELLLEAARTQHARTVASRRAARRGR